jgi:hypothetical protein
MKPVSEEFVEQYFDFFFRLSDAQLKELIVEYKKKQAILYYRNFKIAENFHSKEKKDFFWQTVLMHTYCFESYKGKLPPLTEKLIIQFNKQIKRKYFEIEKNAGENTFLNGTLKQINQPHLFTYLESKIKYFNTSSPLLSNQECSLIYNQIIVLSEYYILIIPYIKD